MSTGGDLTARFTAIYKSNKWQGRTPSGPGASPSATALLRQRLPLVLRAVGARVLLDAPCGDFSWIREPALAAERYIGLDIVPELIKANQRVHGSDRVTFDVANITCDYLPCADLAVCRDCLVHLTAEDAMAAIEQFRSAQIPYLLTTTFYALAENRPGSTGGWRPINLQRPPFNFPPPLVILPERSYDPTQPYSDKSLGLWALEPR